MAEKLPIVITSVALGRIERGKRFPREHILRALVDFTGLTSNQILGIKGKGAQGDRARAAAP